MPVAQAMTNGYGINTTPTRILVRAAYNSTESQSQGSHVLDNTYVISYSIEPMLEHTWQDGPEKTKYTVLHPITTPFMPRPPVVTNNTVPKARVFNVTLGTFLPDVELVKIIVGPETLTVPEANLKGYNVQEHVFPNGSKTYTLQVPFEDPNVKQKVTPPDTRTYILPLTYLLNIVPENTPFTHPAVVEAILKDIIPPTVTGYCDGAAFYTMVTYGNMGRNWVPFVGSRELGGSLLALYKYNANATNFWMTVPYNSVDATYEVISSLGIRSRLDLTLKDIGTMVVVADFSLSCSFPTKMIDCFTNGTMAALAVKVESVPSLSPSQLTLRDPSCRPLQSDAINAVFYFNVNSCGTTRRSHVLDNTYVISYSIEPMLEHTWQDGPEKTKYTVLHPITTPFMPRPPVVTNNTVPKARVFNVTLGTFLPDVELVKIIVGPETLTVPEANLKGYNVQEHVFPNGSKTYTLQVPFEDPNVKQKVTPPDTRTYILPLTYLLNIVPENTPFTHPAVVEAILKDIIPPTVTGYCDGAAFYTMVTYGNMGRNWVPFVGSRELGGSLLALYKYNANATNFWMTVPYNSVDATYEVISSLGIRSRLDLTLKDIGTMVVVADFSLSCSFPTKMIDCFTNGTMAALAVKVESVPSLSPSQLTLRDPSCRPLQSDAINAVFYFNVNSCGTTRRVSIDTY
ncbi:UNVERIFIED_CONTAM: hypothetical protein FKN15_045507 [Acipenser sinensis]